MIQKNWQELIKPNKIEFSSKKKTMTTLVAEPLERGFGLTLGNALRRVLLSSLRGAAVTAVQIDGVLHEFSSIAGVREDVTDIVLNIKEIAIRMEGDGPKRMVVRKQGPGAVLAGDIQTVGDVEILNPDHVICTLDEGAEIRMDQIRKWRTDFKPERVVPYAMAEEKITGTTIAANGAAFRSRRNWYSLKFRCQLAGDGESVVGFEFLVGDLVPREKWDELGLPAVH